MTEQPLITVGIPFYNAEKYLKKAIFSVLNQSYKNFELILTDDGSTDNSLNIANMFNDSRIKTLSDGSNKGISFRLNEQISLARGKYFFRMDADDIMFPNRLEEQLNFLLNNPNIDVIGCNAIIIDNDNNILGQRSSSIPKKINELLFRLVFIHPTVAGKVIWFRKYGYSESLMGIEDFDLWFRSFNNSNFDIIDNPLMFYRDPLKLNIKTYLYRQKQFRNFLKINYRNINLNLIALSYLYSITKSLVFIFLKFIKLDMLVVLRRNKHINKHKDEYSVILNNIINNCI